MQPDGTARATTCYEIRLVHDEIRRGVARRRTAWTFFLSLVVPWSGLLPYDYEPKHECHVEVLRRSHQLVVVSYGYDQELEAINHVQSLRQRAEGMAIADFDRELGIRADW